MKNKKYDSLIKTIIAAMCLALAMVLPLLTGQIPEVGNMLCPMHLPVLLCGFLCGPWYGAAVGVIAPVLRFFVFGAPALWPRGVIMCLELFTYGFVAGMMYRVFPKKKPYIYVSLVIAQIAGRIVWALAHTAIYLVDDAHKFGWLILAKDGFLDAWPGIVLQILVIPPVVMLYRKTAIGKRKR